MSIYYVLTDWNKSINFRWNVLGIVRQVTITWNFIYLGLTCFLETHRKACKLKMALFKMKVMSVVIECCGGRMKELKIAMRTIWREDSE